MDEQVAQLRAEVNAHKLLLGLIIRGLRDNRILDPNRIVEALDTVLVSAASRVPMTGEAGLVATRAIELAREIVELQA
ncbi:hypothetical protein FE249_00885 [Acidiphilium multivorum]|uniref:hypothetical protein n=1 Tax=Acidiphilium multivorum TaxID=62140 RepID=UPI001F4BD851|nr:hypothetical protein [Acidiphilium multivorum]UNC12883.1 hypothetical protein FE249_00885 [Acidiphilium multivorum]